MSGRGVPLALVLLVLLAPTALAETYTSSQHHYSVTVPSTWPRVSPTGVDAAWAGPTYQGFDANINVVVVLDSGARNTDAWLLSGAQAGYGQVLNQFNGTSVQAPRSFTTGSGRPAADYVIDYDFSGFPLRVRQVLFASDVRDRAYVLSFTAHRNHFPSLMGVRDGVVDSFTVNESTAGDLLIWIAVGIGAGVAAAGAVAVVAKRRQKTAIVSPLPPPAFQWPSDPPPYGPPPPPPSPPTSPPTPPSQ